MASLKNTASMDNISLAHRLNLVTMLTKLTSIEILSSSKPSFGEYLVGKMDEMYFGVSIHRDCASV